ncbi:hypothetical protein B0H13DRAFT_1888517 [Mycena leptocephala]|nr:hypothetical protein B0H13DRAFT_1888517 [Mycena leptocephala]
MLGGSLGHGAAFPAYWFVPCEVAVIKQIMLHLVNHGKAIWPRIIYRLFADYTPIQATSVPSERVFSSSAETDTKRRNHISPSAPVAYDEEDWLRVLATAAEDQRDIVRREISDNCDFAETAYLEMPEENDSSRVESKLLTSRLVESRLDFSSNVIFQQNCWLGCVLTAIETLPEFNGVQQLHDDTSPQSPVNTGHDGDLDLDDAQPPALTQAHMHTPATLSGPAPAHGAGHASAGDKRPNPTSESSAPPAKRTMSKGKEPKSKGLSSARASWPVWLARLVAIFLWKSWENRVLSS